MATAEMEQAIKEYYAENGVSHEMARRVGPELESTADLTDSQVVEYVREKPAMAIHQYLIWHDYSAAELYRREQVRFLRRMVKVRIISPAGETIETRVVYRVKVTTLDPKDERCDPSGQPAIAAITYENAIESALAMGEIMDKARRDLSVFGRRYRDYRFIFAQKEPEFDALFDVIDRIEAGAERDQAA